MRPDHSRSQLLVIDDEPQIRRMLRLSLEEKGYEVHEAENGRDGLNEAIRRAPDAVILDLGLPDVSGVEVLQQLRLRSSVPVLILSVFGAEERKISGLDAGADDYLTKPFSEGELLARLRALLRRIKPVSPSTVFRFGRIEVNFERRSVMSNGQTVKLTRMEYDLLQLFIAHRDKALTHRQILRELWGPKAEGQTHYLRTYMMRLRQKLGDDDEDAGFFRTESGVGYRFVTDGAN